MKIVNISGSTELIKQAINLPGWYTIGIYDPLRKFLQDTYGVEAELLNHGYSSVTNQYFKNSIHTVLKNLATKANNESFEMTVEQHALDLAKKIISCYDNPNAEVYPFYHWSQGIYWSHLCIKKDKGIFIVDDIIDPELRARYDAKKLFIFKPVVQFKIKRQDEFIVYTDEINPSELQYRLDSV